MFGALIIEKNDNYLNKKRDGVSDKTPSRL